MTLQLQSRLNSGNTLYSNELERRHFSTTSNSSYHSSSQLANSSKRVQMTTTTTKSISSSNVTLSSSSKSFNDMTPRLALSRANQSSSSKHGQGRFEVLSESFYDLLGSRPQVRKLLKTKDGKALFHEAGIYLRDSNQIILSTNRFCNPKNHYDQHIGIVHIPLKALPLPNKEGVIYPNALDANQQAEIWNQITFREHNLGDHLIMPNGATRWPLEDGRDGVLWCEQGKHDLQVKDPCQAYIHSALVVYDPSSYETKPLLDSYQDKRFTSLNDVVVHPSGAVFFTDPDYGVEQLFKRNCQIQTCEYAYAPKGLYCWQPKSGQVELLDNQYFKPNGCTFVPDPSKPKDSGCGALITTETGRLRFNHSCCPITGKTNAEFVEDPNKPACIYAYPVNYENDAAGQNGMPFVNVQKRQLVAHSTSGAPDGIHPDEKGNIWAGHGDGVHVYSIDWSLLSQASKRNDQKAIGKLIGKIRLPDNHGVANFCWAGPVSDQNKHSSSQQYRMLLFAEDELWEAIVGVNGFD